MFPGPLQPADDSVRFATAHGNALEQRGRGEARLEIGSQDNLARVLFRITDSQRKIFAVSRLEAAGYDVCFGSGGNYAMNPFRTVLALTS